MIAPERICPAIINFLEKRGGVKRVLGIGGVFFKANDAVALRQWYRLHLGIDVQDWGGAVFPWEGVPGGSTTWSIFAESSDYFSPGTRRSMVNYIVADLREVLAALRAEGCNVDDRVEESEYGIFGWVIDPEGNRLELWQPPEKPPY
jgi:predicted enzyme related to lactoylglutathione lyase